MAFTQISTDSDGTGRADPGGHAARRRAGRRGDRTAARAEGTPGQGPRRGRGESAQGRRTHGRPARRGGASDGRRFGTGGGHPGHGRAGPPRRLHPGAVAGAGRCVGRAHGVHRQGGEVRRLQRPRAPAGRAAAAGGLVAAEAGVAPEVLGQTASARLQTALAAAGRERWPGAAAARCTGHRGAERRLRRACWSPRVRARCRANWCCS